MSGENSAGGKAPEGLSEAEVLSQGAENIAKSCSEDLSALLARPVELRLTGVEQIERSAVAERDDPLLHQLCRISGDPGADLHLLMPRPEAMRAAALQLGQDGEGAESSELDGEMRAAFQVVAKLVGSSLSRPLQEEGLGGIETRDAREIPEPASDPTWLLGERFVRIRYELAIEGLPEGRLDVLLAESAAEDSADLSRHTLCFLVDDEAERAGLEELGSAAEMPVSWLTPERLREGADDVLDNAGAIVVPWEIGGRAGIELVDAFASDPRTREVPVFMASEAPTRAMVVAALRAGARSFVMRPYDSAELCQRIAELRGESARDAASASAGSGDA